MTSREFKKNFPPRPRASHKGDFGKVFILSGAKGFPGAPYLVSMGALRAGAGLITLGVPEGIYPVLARRLTEVMTKPLPQTRGGALSLRAETAVRRYLKDQDVLAVGPGLGREPETQKLVRRLVSRSDMPVVLDADGLNAFHGAAGKLKSRRARTVATPHPGEAARLFGETVPKDDRGRKNYALRMARRYGIVLLLKGHHTVTAGPDGQVDVNPTGNPGMAKGGSGDLLTGIVAAFLGQGLEPFAAAKCAAFIHGLAGDLAAKETGEISLTPTDMIRFLPLAFRKVLGR